MNKKTNSQKLHNLPTFYQPSIHPVWVERIVMKTPRSMPEYHYHNSYELYYLKRGERYYFVKNQTYLVKQGSLVLIDKYDVHITTPPADSGYERILINFTDEFIEGISSCIKKLDLLAPFSAQVPIIKLEPEEQQKIESILLSMVDEQEGNKYGKEDFIRSGLLQLLIFASRRISGKSQFKSTYNSITHKTISEITSHINDHFKDNISLDYLSKNFHISPNYISRLFRETAGITFVDYLNNVRIKEAQKLLTMTELNMQQICENTGYKSYTHFARIFKSIIGVSPMKYKKLHNAKRL